MQGQLVIIPTYQPTEKLIDIVEELNKINLKSIIVNDGSTENLEIFDKLKEKTIILHHKENCGKGAALKTALKYIQENQKDINVIGTMDSDGQHLVSDMKKVLDKVDKDNLFVLGVRNFENDIPLKSKLGNKLTRVVFGLFSKQKVSDTQTGLRAFSSELIPILLEINGTRYEYEMNVLLEISKRNIKISEVPIETIYHDKNNSCSHFNGIKDSFRIYKEIIKFSLVSFSSFIIDYLLFALFVFLFNNTILSNVLARIISAIYNYCLNCKYVFKSKRDFKNLLQYFLLATFILIMNSIILDFYINKFGLDRMIAKVLTEITLFVISFLYQKIVIFNKKEGTNK